MKLKNNNITNKHTNILTQTQHKKKHM